MLTSLRKSSSVSSFSVACFRFTHSARSFFYFSPKCLFSASLYQRIRLFALLTAGKGNRTGIVRGDFRFMNFTTFCYLFFLLLIFFWKTFFFTHDIYPHPHPRPTTSTHYPQPTTFSYTPFTRPLVSDDTVDDCRRY